MVSRTDRVKLKQLPRYSSEEKEVKLTQAVESQNIVRQLSRNKLTLKSMADNKFNENHSVEQE